MHPASTRRLASILATAILLGGCASNDDVGGRKVDVTLAVHDVHAGAAVTADVYLLTSEQWVDVRGPDRLREITQSAASNDSARATDVRRALLADLGPYRQNEQAPLATKLKDVVHYFVACAGDRLDVLEFRPSRNRTPTVLLR